MNDYADKRPWLNLPNPFGFMPLYDQINHIYPIPNVSYSSSKPKGLRRRTVPVGKDWLGVGFQKGDIVLGTVSGSNELLVVDEIFLDDGSGRPYSSHTNLVLQKSSGRLLYAGLQWDPSYRTSTPELQEVEMSWIGNHLSLLGENGTPHGLNDDFIGLSFQHFRVRCAPLVKSSWGSNAKRSLAQHQVTVIGQDTDRNLLELRLACGEIPRIGDPMPYIAKN